MPEVFLPSESVPVQFFDVTEGAGFENSFGWYNVGDDVLSVAGRTANLHRVMQCSLEPGGSVTVDFAAERAALRYKGGFIAFYLITPEGNPSNNNCGDLGLGSDNLSLLGRIYYTQADLNNDGDFVHHLVYTSPNVANRFYFGFEDLFRGGDNDFEDMLIRVTGLTPPCTPQAEICDGLDNDCDGLVDALDPNLTDVGNDCACDGVMLTCVGGPRAGECRTGVTVCRTAQIQCQSTVNPTGELCDGLDNNCNNQVDDNPSGTGMTCDGGDADVCPEGNIVCLNGALECNDNTGANQEICDGVDVLFVRSTDAGVTFSAERIIDDPVSEVSSSFSPQLALDPRTAVATDDVVALVWEDRREGAQIYGAVSLTSGSGFAAAKRVSSVNGEPATGASSVPFIAHVGSGTMVVAYQNRLTAASSRVYVASSIDNGTSWSYNHALADTGGGQALAPRCVPVVQGGKRGGLASWSDFRAGTKINGDIYTMATTAP